MLNRTNIIILTVVGVIIVLGALGYFNRDYIYQSFTTAPAVEETVEADPPSPEEESQKITKISHDCQVAGEVLEDNQQWFQAHSTLVAIIADESTTDEAYGPSHRIFVAYNTFDCSEKLRATLPVNFSPDFPYYLTTIDSLQGELIGIQAVDKFYVYDVINNKLSEAIAPSFGANRQMEDAQSGTILGLLPYGRYVVGYVEDHGVFAYNMTIPTTPKQETPFAEYQASDNDFSAMFLLKSKDKGEMPVAPSYDPNTGKLEINPLLEEPQEVSELKAKSPAANRYVILRLKDEKRTPVAVDLKTKRKVMIDAKLADKADAEILNSLKAIEE